MWQNLNFRENAQRVYLYYHQDGLVDIFIGLGILFLGLSMFAEAAWMVAIYPILLLPAWQSVKKSITAPRMGWAELALVQRVRKRLDRTLVVSEVTIMLLLLLGLFMFWVQERDNTPPALQRWFKEYFGLALGLSGALFASLTAFLSGIKRFHLYAISGVVVFVAGYLLDMSLSLSVSLMGGLTLLIGSAALVRFLCRHPVLA